MPDYANGKIYKIVNDENDKIYIGSTCSALAQRMGGHRYKSKELNRVNGIYQAMRQLGTERFQIRLIKSAPCKCKTELEEIEYNVIQKYKSRGIELYNLKEGKGKLAQVSRELNGRMRSGTLNTNFGKRGVETNNFRRGCISKEQGSLARWLFRWQDDERIHKRSFSINKYGNKKAYRLAKQVQDQTFPRDE